MNSVVNTTSHKSAYHTVANAEFTGFYDRMVYNFTNNPGDNRIGSISGYHLFIRYGDKVYMEVKGVGEIVISFAELQKNKYWKYYYYLSLLLTNDKHMLFQHLHGHSSNYELNYQIYDEERFWAIDTAFIETSMNTRGAKVVNNEALCYYKINPYNMVNMEYSSQEEVNTFQRIYMTRNEIKNNVFDKMCVIYNKLIIDYRTSTINKELVEINNEIDELSAFFENKKNVVNLLVTINDKYIMNEDIIRMIMNNYLY